jgi:alkyl sulfatase BDS1-like metallo-beta-lactamase superfamily hydrolase
MRTFPQIAALLFAAVTAQGQDAVPSDPIALLRMGSETTEAVEIHPQIFQAIGFGNTFMVATDDGNVIIDTSLAFHAPRSKKQLQAIDDGPIKYIILTHAHGDHRGGVDVWREDGTEVIAQRNYIEFRHHQARLAPFFNRRNQAQFGGMIPPRPEVSGPDSNYPATLEPTVYFDDVYKFELGDLRFEVHHTPGETYDHASVWIPELKAAFVGDNFYGSFPNMYTLRGTKPRWALDYVHSINTVLTWEPELLMPSHGMATVGFEEIEKQLTRYRDAILHVHDATVAGMNAGKDVFMLMDEIKLPPELDVGEGYGTIAWTVRGIYEGYAGWFDGNPATMYSTPPSAAYPDIVELAGGPEAVAHRATGLVDEGNLHRGLHLADMALAAEPDNEVALRARIKALEALEAASTNSNETGWLRAGIAASRDQLK